MKPAEVSAKLEVKIGDQAVTKSDALKISDVRPDSCTLYVSAKQTKKGQICTIPDSKCVTEAKPTFVLIQSDTYDAGIKYAVAKYEPKHDQGGGWFSLEYPHLYLGEGQVNVLIQSADGESAELTGPKYPGEMKIYVKNCTSKDVLVTVHWGLVERPKAPAAEPQQPTQPSKTGT